MEPYSLGSKRKNLLCCTPFKGETRSSQEGKNLRMTQKSRRFSRFYAFFVKLSNYFVGYNGVNIQQRLKWYPVSILEETAAIICLCQIYLKLFKASKRPWRSQF